MFGTITYDSFLTSIDSDPVLFVLNAHPVTLSRRSPPVVTDSLRSAGRGLALRLVPRRSYRLMPQPDWLQSDNEMLETIVTSSVCEALGDNIRSRSFPVTAHLGVYDVYTDNEHGVFSDTPPIPSEPLVTPPSFTRFEQDNQSVTLSRLPLTCQAVAFLI
ncbi:unnamed protein product [Ixodes pacificus]